MGFGELSERRNSSNWTSAGSKRPHDVSHASAKHLCIRNLTTPEGDDEILSRLLTNEWLVSVSSKEKFGCTVYACRQLFGAISQCRGPKNSPSIPGCNAPVSADQAQRSWSSMLQSETSAFSLMRIFAATNCEQKISLERHCKGVLVLFNDSLRAGRLLVRQHQKKSWSWSATTVVTSHITADQWKRGHFHKAREQWL